MLDNSKYLPIFVVIERADNSSVDMPLLGMFNTFHNALERCKEMLTGLPEIDTPLIESLVKQSNEGNTPSNEDRIAMQTMNFVEVEVTPGCYLGIAHYWIHL